MKIIRSCLRKFQFRIFKQVPRIIYGRDAIKRFRELLPENGSNGLILVDKAVVSKVPKLLLQNKSF